MGIDYYVVNHRDKTMFSLGKAYNFESLHEDYGDYWKVDKDFLTELMKEAWAEWADGVPAGYPQYFLDRLWRFMDGVPPKEITVVNDAGDEYFELRYHRDERGAARFRDESGRRDSHNYRITDGRFVDDEDVEHYLKTGEFRKYKFADEDS